MNNKAEHAVANHIHENDSQASLDYVSTSKLHFHVLTLFPEQIDYNMSLSIMGRAQDKHIYHLNIVNIRDFADNDYGKIDDSLYGGGAGMLMQAEPIYQAFQSLNISDVELKKTAVLYPSPKGKQFTQAKAMSLSKLKHIVLICGHYEGIDNRLLEKLEVEEISLGPYVISGGELASVILMDAVTRLLPGTLQDPTASADESYMQGLLECRHYTKPASWRGLDVPSILTSGNHEKIAHWRYNDSIRETVLKAPELLNSVELHTSELEYLIKNWEND